MAEQTEEQKQAAEKAAAIKAAAEKSAKERQSLKDDFEREAKKPGRYIVGENLVDAHGKVILPIIK